MHKACLAGVKQEHEEQLAEAQKGIAEQLAQADSRMQAMKQEMLEQYGRLERRLKDSEEASEARKAAHDKTLSKLMAQQARKVRPWCSLVMLCAWRSALISDSSAACKTQGLGELPLSSMQDG